MRNLTVVVLRVTNTKGVIQFRLKILHTVINLHVLLTMKVETH